MILELFLELSYYLGHSFTECWSQGRAKLRDFLRNLARENTQLSPSFTPTLGIVVTETEVTKVPKFLI